MARVLISRVLAALVCVVLLSAAIRVPSGWVMPDMGGKPIIWFIKTPEEIAEKRTGALGLAWPPVFNGTACVIWTPPINSRKALGILQHEVKHCVDGYWHKDIPR